MFGSATQMAKKFVAVITALQMAAAAVIGGFILAAKVSGTYALLGIILAFIIFGCSLVLFAFFKMAENVSAIKYKLQEIEHSNNNSSYAKEQLKVLLDQGAIKQEEYDRRTKDMN